MRAWLRNRFTKVNGREELNTANSQIARVAGSMSRVLEMVADTDRVYRNSALAQAQFAGSMSRVLEMVADTDRVYRNSALALPLFEGSLRQIIAAYAELPQLHFPEHVDTGHVGDGSPSIGIAASAQIAEIEKSRKLSSRELAAWLTAITCVCVYLSLAVAREYSAQAALILSTDGPSPFDGATVPVPLIFAVWMMVVNRRPRE